MPSHSYTPKNRNQLAALVTADIERAWHDCQDWERLRQMIGLIVLNGFRESDALSLNYDQSPDQEFIDYIRSFRASFKAPNSAA